MATFGPLVSTAWLAESLANTDLRVYDTTVSLRPNPDGPGYLAESGRDQWACAHIPGAMFLDLITELSDADNDVPYMMPAPARFAETVSGYGVSDDTRVVVYTTPSALFPTASVMWATRAWWMFRAVGFDNVAVLDGGWSKWQAEGRPSSDVASVYPAGRLTPRARPELWADKEEMLRVMDDKRVCVINALSPQVYSGESNTYGRAGHIPGSYNVFFGNLLDERDGTFLPAATLAEQFRGTGALESDRVITYCGGGISATMDALALHLAGHENIAVYDGSMTEWCRDPTLPLVTGASV